MFEIENIIDQLIRLHEKEDSLRGRVLIENSIDTLKDYLKFKSEK